ncbi:MAG: succinate dehydrogenase (quinone) flavoprotein subunit [Acidimicrobiia bacterium]|nr:succinate dehydrogenase (quinone) flavoprotein subunit [Acidimicrobiia bacterium]
MSTAKPTTIVVGGGLGGLWATLRLVEAGIPVKLFSLFEVKRSHSACAQGGINAALDTKGQGDSVWQHIVDTIKGGAYLADQPPIKTMCEEAPGLIHTFERMGVTFSRTPEGLLDLRLFGGVKYKRTAFAGSSTGQQLLYGVDEQVRRYEDRGLVEKHEWWEMLSIVTDSEGRCRGITALDLRSQQVQAFPADAVILATGGIGLIYGKSTNSSNSTGAAASRVYQQGAWFMNGEFIQYHPTGMIGDDKLRLMSEASRGEGGRIWTPRLPGDSRDPRSIPEDERFYFLEEWYPTYGNTVPRDVAARAIWRVVKHLGLGVRGEDRVFLDLTHLPADFVRRRLGSIIEIYEDYTGADPTQVPMEIFPAPHYSMGGLWVDWEADPATGGMKHGSPRNHQTNIAGLFACGECDGAYHGANRLGANSMLSASFSGRVAGESAAAYVKGLARVARADLGNAFDAERDRQEEINRAILTSEGSENPFALHRELGKVMTDKVGVERDNRSLDEAIGALQELRERFRHISLDDRGPWVNSSLPYARQVHDMIVLGQVIAAGARLRDECRGSHYKAEFELKIPEGKFPGDPEWEEYLTRWKEKNERWLKTTVARYAPEGPEIEYHPVDTSVLPPETPRDYR